MDVEPAASVVIGDSLVRRDVVQRVYFAFGPMLQTLRSCRPVVAADATFMTGSFPSTLYVIVGKDANNHLVPAAFMLAWSAERMSDWKPFLEKFKPLMPHVTVCISDAAKGLLEAIEQVGWRQSRCVRHMYGNMRTSGITRGVSETQVCNLAKLCSKADFDYVVGKIKDENPDAALFLQAHAHEYSAVTFLPDHPRFGDALNNAAECFNSILVRETAGQRRVKDMGWVSVITALRRHMHKWHTERYGAPCCFQVLARLILVTLALCGVTGCELAGV